MNHDLASDATLVALSNLSSGLWRIQELLDLLTYKLEVQQLLIETGTTRWIGRSTREVEIVLNEMRQAELMRAVDTGPVCAALGMPGDVSLSEIAAVAPAPWNHVLAEHRVALTKATGHLAMLSKSNGEILEASYRAVQEALDRFNHRPDVSTYTARGARDTRRLNHMFDQTT